MTGTRFGDQVAIVTGAAQGIGLGVAARLARDGARVVLCDRNPETLDGAVTSLRGEFGEDRIHAECFDVSDSASVTAAVDHALGGHGRIDVLVNNAGILRDNWIELLEDEDWNAVVATNLGGAFFCSRAVVPAMKAAGYGRIVNVSSRSWMGNPGQSNYSAAKAGVVGLTRALALELVRFGITVNAIAPGLIETPMTLGLRPDVRERLIAAQPGARMGTVDEVAATVAFLASREASFVTGQVVSVCGGKSLGMGGVA